MEVTINTQTGEALTPEEVYQQRYGRPVVAPADIQVETGRSYSFGMDTSTGTMRTHVERPVIADTAEGFGSAATQGSVLSSARTKGGSPVFGRPVQAGDIVTVPGGMTMEASSAASLGYLTQNPDGTFSAPTGKPEAGGAATTGTDAPSASNSSGVPSDADAEAFRADEATVQSMNEVVKAIGTSTAIATLGSFLDGDGEVSDALLGTIATKLGVGHEEASAKVSSVFAGLEAAVDKRLTAAGVHDLDTYEEWLGSDARRVQQYRDAAQALATSGNTSGFDKLAASFVETLPEHSPEDLDAALSAAGVRTTRGPRGELLLDLPDVGQVSWHAAIKQGLIGVSIA